MKKPLLLILLAFTFKTLAAQDFDYGKYDSKAMEMKVYDKDTSAHAVVISEFGKAYVSSEDGMPQMFEYHVKIKILDSKGFDEGNIVLHTYVDGERFEKITDIAGITFYKDEIGGVQTTELDQKKIYKEQVDKHHERIKFALPNLRPGCIIEYKYTLRSPYHFNFPTWQFQSNIPKIYTEYEAHIPAIYEYNIAKRGALSLTVNTAELERDCFSYYGTRCDCSKLTFGMKDVPAFVDEDYMTSPANFISAIYFELSQMTNDRGVKIKITKEWPDIDHELKANESFGDQMKRKDLFKQRLIPVIAGLTDSLQKAKAVYSYIQNWFKWNDHNSMYSTDGIKQAIEGHTGNSADINLSLVAALTQAGLNTEAVILSTRENGFVNKLYPEVSSFNYVIAKVNIGPKSYLLDATDPLLAFGMLPLRCINDQGRVMSLNKPSYWIDMVSSQKNSTTASLDLTLQDDGKIKGTITTYSMGYAAYEKRKAIKKFNTTDEYVENLDEKLTKLKILKSEITNLDSLSLPLTEKYDVVIDGYNSLNHEAIAFEPSFWHHIINNPFKLNERTYPVDLGSASDHKMVVTLHYPPGFEISTQPVQASYTLPNKAGKYLTDFSTDPGAITYSQVEQFSLAIYPSEFYPYIKELYNKMIQDQKANIVFKKKAN